MMNAQFQLLTIYLCLSLSLLVYGIVNRRKKGQSKDYKIFWLLMVAYQLLSFPIILTYDDRLLITLCLSVTLMLAFLNHFVVEEKTKALYLIIPFIQILSIVTVVVMAETTEFKVIILVVVLSILNEYPIEFSRRFALFPLLLYMLVSALVMIRVDGVDYMEVAIYVIRNTITYVMVVGSYYLLRKQAVMNESLQNMARELEEKNQKIEEISLLKERNRIAREIHDTLGHTLTGAIIQLEAAKKLIHIDQERTLSAIEKTQRITRDGFLEVKRAIHALKPVLIEDGNLKDALEAMLEKIRNDFKVSIDYYIVEDESIDEALKNALYRIIQESITNSIRHGKASEIIIRLESTSSSVTLSIVDNGSGCVAIHEGNGLKGIRKRVNNHHGKINLKSSPDAGFQIMVMIPKN